jgi:hypothetical protein
MTLTKQEIDEALAHQQKMLRVLRQRLQQRELQEAQLGINVPPEVMTEIQALNERVRIHESEIERLQTLAAEGQLSVAEAEYRAILADVWGTPQGRPTVAGATRLELARLRLGVPIERAQALEHELRVALANETFSEIDSLSLFKLGRIQNIMVGKEAAEQDIAKGYRRKEMEVALQLIGRTIRLDAATALCLIVAHTPLKKDANFLYFKSWLLMINKVRYEHDDNVLFQKFLGDLENKIL